MFNNLDENGTLQSSFSERVLVEVLKVKERDNCSIFDACVTYCEENELDVEDLTESLDEYAKEMLRQSAIQERKVRISEVPRVNVLQFK